jgi:hypothetical protein
MKAKIIQISTTDIVEWPCQMHTITALCEDGSVWKRCDIGDWEEIPLNK